MADGARTSPRDRGVDYRLDPAARSSRCFGHVGLVSTPKYFDDVVQEVLRAAPAGIGVIQRVMAVDATFWAALREVGLPATPGFGSLPEASRG